MKRTLPWYAAIPVAGLVGAVLFGAVSLAFSQKPAHALTNCTIASEGLDSEESAFLTLINNYRTQNGRVALKISTNLNRASAWLSNDMGAKGYFSHTDSLGRSPSTRAQNCGYPGGAGENIAAGTSWDTAQEAFTAWKNSSGHNANMLNSNYRYIGIGRVYVGSSQYKWYWTTDFGIVNDGTSSSTPTATQTSGGSTPTATPTSTSTSSLIKSTIWSPTPGSQFTSTYVTFRWTAKTGATAYRIDVGTTRGGVQYGRTTTGSTSKTVYGLPRGGVTIWVRLWTRQPDGVTWAYNDYSFKSAP
jgi:uncharacterized protein YkwD